MKKPRFTDSAKFRKPYVRVEDMGPGYLAEKFEKMQRRQEKNDAEAERKVEPLLQRRRA